MRLGGSGRNILWVAVVTVLVMALVALATGGSARGRYQTSSRRIAPGVKLVKIHDRRGPNRIRVLKIDPASQVTLDVALATEELPGHETTTSMARRHNAVAAINGDFTLLPGSAGSGRPVNTYIEDGHLKASPLIWGRNFSISRAETLARVGHTRLRSWVISPAGERWWMRATNPLDPYDKGMTMYTPAGGKLFRPPPDSCAARLLASGVFGWNGDLDGVSRDFVVDEVICRQRSINRRGGNLLSARRGTSAALQLQSLLPGQSVGYGWSFNRGQILDTIGGNPDLLEGGRIVGGECEGSYFCDLNPRTGIGITPRGKILLVTVDGRSRSSVGMTLGQFGQLFRYLGAESALNLDGGGSTTMVVRGDIVNVPSGGFERPVGTSLLVLPGPDGGELEPGPYATPTPTASPLPTITPTVPPTTTPAPTDAGEPTIVFDGIQSTVDVGCRILSDPGSTGGLLDALAKGQLGSKRDLPPSLRAALRVFRGNAACP
jgi:hypothetical protein